MMSTSEKALQHLDDVAADWLIRRDAGFSAEEFARFEDWLAADPRHGVALAEMEAALAVLNQPRERHRADGVLRELSDWEQHRRRRGRKTVAFSSILAAAAAIAFAFLPGWRSGAGMPARSGSMVVVRPDRQVLPDGSVVELNAGAQIAAEFSSTKRGIRLLRGVAHFDVAKESGRPFVVSAGAVEVRAVGTAFAVRLGAGEIDVLVTEGLVAVAPSGELLPGVGQSALSTPADTVQVMVPAGAKVAVPAGGLSPDLPRVQQVTAAEIDAALSWRGMRLEFTDTPLAEALEKLNRGGHVRLTLGDPALADVRVSGIYWADDPEGFAKLLESSLDLKAVREAPGQIVLRSR